MTRLALFPLLFVLTTPAQAQTTYVFGIPSKTTTASAKEILGAFLGVVRGAKPGDRVDVLNAFALEPITSFEIPTGNERRRMMLLGRRLGAMQRFVRGSIDVQSGVINLIRFPQFTALAARSMGRTPHTRILVFGESRYANPRDPRFSFGGETYPGDGHVRASMRASIYGTAEKKALLRGAAVHFCFLKESRSSELAEIAVQRFWSLFLKEQSGVLASWNVSGKAVVREALSERVEPVMQASLNPRDTGLLMHSVSRPPPPEPPSAQVVFVQDGSISNKDELATSRQNALAVARKAGGYGMPLKIGAVVYREQENTFLCPPEEIVLEADGKAGPGYRRLHEFVTGEDLEVNIAEFKPNSEEGRLTGKTRKVSRMAPIGARVDIVHGLSRAIDLLGAPSGKVTSILVLCGDVSYQERSTDQAASREAAARLLTRLRDFAEVHPKTHIVSVFTPAVVLSSQQKESERFFRDVAAAAGTNGMFTNRVTSVPQFIEKILRRSRVSVVQRDR